MQRFNGKLAINQQHRLVDMRINREIDADIFAGKQTELRDRIAALKLQLDVVDRSNDEMCDLAVKVFELSQSPHQKWVTADYATKRRILEIVFLTCRLDDVTLVPTMRKPLDVFAEGLVLKNSRGDCPSFEPLKVALLEAAFSRTSEAVVDFRLIRLSD